MKENSLLLDLFFKISHIDYIEQQFWVNEYLGEVSWLAMVWKLLSENYFQKYVTVLTKINKSNLSHTFDMYRHSFRKCGVKLFEFLRCVKLFATHDIPT